MLKTNPAQITLTDISSSEDPKFMLHEDVEFEYKTRDRYISLIIPAGFTTDFGSVPKAFRIVVPNVGKYDAAYILHDFMYSKLCKLNISRGEADVILRKNLQYLGMGDIRAWGVYWSVKYFGGSHFRDSE